MGKPQLDLDLEELTNNPKLKYSNTLIDTWKKRFESIFINVKDFGAVGNGVEDDTVAIQNAINYLKSLDGGTLFFPKGIYIITTVLEYGDKIFFEGVNMHHSYWNWESAHSIIKCSETFNGTSDIEGTQKKVMIESRKYKSCGMINMCIDGNSQADIGFSMHVNDGEDYNSYAFKGSDGSSGVGVYFEKCQFLHFNSIGLKVKYKGINKIMNCNFAQCNIGVQFYQGGDSVLIGNYFNTNSSCGLSLLHSGNTTVIGGKIEYNDVGILLSNCDDIILNAINIDGNGETGVKIVADTSGQFSKNNIINACVFANNGKDITTDDSAHIYANNFKDINIVGNTFRGGDIGNPQFAIRVPNFDVNNYNDGLQVVGNMFSDNCYISKAIQAWQCTKNHVIRDNKGLSTSNVTLGDGNNEPVYQIP